MPQAMEMLRSALRVHDPAAALFELSGELGAKRSLRDMGRATSKV